MPTRARPFLAVHPMSGMGLFLLHVMWGYGNRFYRRKELIVVVKDVFDLGANPVSSWKSWVPIVHLSLQEGEMACRISSSGSPRGP